MIVLTDTITVKNLTRLKVQSVQYEANQERGQEYVEVYCDYGFMDDGTFYAYPVPGIMTSVKYFKFENGMHPEVPGMMLGKCSECNKWFFLNSGPCDEPGCAGVIEPFPSYNRFRNKIDASTERDVFTATEAFLVHKDGSEGMQFPNPEDIDDVRPLVDGTA
jgi:hypothetical protein